jgi:SAM-dependent methyltransferase
MPNTMNGRDIYAAKYAADLEGQVRWLAHGAIAKANSVELLMQQQRQAEPNSVLELGAGTGAVIAELQRRRFGRKFLAVDYSADACAHMRRTLPEVSVIQADITKDSLAANVDLLVLSHVVEHLEDPDAFLEGVARNINFEWAVIEVPLENLPVARLKYLVKDPKDNLAGHVQFFTASTFRMLVSRHLQIVAARRYVPRFPREVVQFVCRKNGAGVAKTAFKQFTMNIGPALLDPLWKRMWMANYAVLCRKKPTYAD